VYVQLKEIRVTMCTTVNVTIDLSANIGQIYLHDIYVLFIVGKHIRADACIVD